MRTHGWGGETPRDDSEALDRILDAGRAIIAEHRRPARLAEVARELEISRATVYRYVNDSEELLLAIAAAEARPFLDGLRADLADVTDPATAVVGAVAYVIDRLPDNPYLALALAPGAGASVVASITSPSAQAFGREMLRALDVEWDAHGFDDDRLALLVEQMLRLVQSFILDPGTPPRHGADLAGYLDFWLRPAIRTTAGHSVQ